MPQKIRCKFRCVSVTKTEAWAGASVPFHYSATFNAVVASSKENKKFFESTPSGTIEVRTVREDHFHPGQEYYVDFEPAEAI